jgi:hypothetical protein
MSPLHRDMNHFARCKQNVFTWIRQLLTQFSRYDERVPENFQQREPVHRYYREDLPVTEDRRRPPPLHPRRLDDVIVLE